MGLMIPIVLLAILAVFLLEPAMILDAAKSGLFTWFETVVPALFPFFVLNGLMMSYGVIDLLSRPFSPLTRRIFHLPGEAAFVLITGYTTGSPVSATLVGDLYRQEKITKKEGERLLAISANASPIFILSVAAISFLQRPDLGLTLLLVVYGSNLCLGIVWGFLSGGKAAEKQQPLKKKAKKIPPAGKTLMEAIFQAISSLGLVGGLIIIFFIIIAVVNCLPFNWLMAMAFPSLTADRINPLINGILEMTAGLKALKGTDVAIRMQLAFASGILAFGGLCVHMQIATQIEGTKLNIQKFAAYKGIQATLAFLIAFFIPIEEETIALAPSLIWPAELSLKLLLGPYALCVTIGLLTAGAAKIISRHCCRSCCRHRR